MQYNPDLEEVPVPTRNVPIVKTETRTVTYEREGFPLLDSEDGVLVSSRSHSTKMQTIETTTVSWTPACCVVTTSLPYFPQHLQHLLPLPVMSHEVQPHVRVQMVKYCTCPLCVHVNCQYCSIQFFTKMIVWG